LGLFAILSQDCAALRPGLNWDRRVAAEVEDLSRVLKQRSGGTPGKLILAASGRVLTNFTLISPTKQFFDPLFISPLARGRDCGWLAPTYVEQLLLKQPGQF
jgi:hypothetical protein